MKPSRAFLGIALAILAASACTTFLIYELSLPFGPLELRRRPAYDTYAQFVPNASYAAESLARGGGLLWNPYQSCGTPFFADVQTGLLYPPHWIFFLLPAGVALYLNIALHLAIAAAGMHALGRAYGLGAAASLGGALALQAGGATMSLAVWSPTHIGPYAWIPLVLVCGERLLRRTDAKSALALAAALAVQLLPGFPQTVFFTCQLLALRFVWSILVERRVAAGKLAGLFVLAIVGTVLLTAVQLVPSIELASESLRGKTLGAGEIGQGLSTLSAVHLLAGAAGRQSTGMPPLLSLVVLGVAGAGLVAAAHRALAVFWTLATLLYVALALGPGTPLFDLYSALPLGSVFRGPNRFLWVAGFAVSVLTAIGIEAIVAHRRSATERRWSGAALVLLPFGVAAFSVARLLGAEIAREQALPFLAIFALAAVASHSRSPGGTAIRWMLPLAVWATILANSRSVPQVPRLTSPLGPHANLMRLLDEVVTEQDRVFFATLPVDLSLTPKRAMVERLPSPYDYQLQAPRRYAEFFTRAITSRSETDFAGWSLLGLKGWFYRNILRRFDPKLFGLTASRYIVVPDKIDTVAEAFGRPLPLLLEDDGLRVYENTFALPRAFFASRAVVVPDQELLDTIARKNFDLRTTIAVSARPTDPRVSLGQGGLGFSSTEFLRDDPEHVAIQVYSPDPGFLFLADQYFPGWSATVNGNEAEILRANYTFRAVAVGSGTSVVEFRYRPASVRAGAAVSVVSLLLFLAAWLGLERRRDRSLN